MDSSFSKEFEKVWCSLKNVPKDEVNPVMEIGWDKRTLKSSTILQQVVWRAFCPERKLHISDRLPILPWPQRQLLPIDEKSAPSRGLLRLLQRCAELIREILDWEASAYCAVLRLADLRSLLQRVTLMSGKAQEPIIWCILSQLDADKAGNREDMEASLRRVCEVELWNELLHICRVACCALIGLLDAQKQPIRCIKPAIL